eukprot:12341013-Ditylum_brightwellii.AAC.1
MAVGLFPIDKLVWCYYFPLMWVVGRISRSSHALFTANHQYAAGSIAPVIQLWAMVELLGFGSSSLIGTA